MLAQQGVPADGAFAPQLMPKPMCRASRATSGSAAHPERWATAYEGKVRAIGHITDYWPECINDIGKINETLKYRGNCASLLLWMCGAGNRTSESTSCNRRQNRQIQFNNQNSSQSQIVVNAENVILAGNNNSLTSENLQQALNNEIAPDLHKILSGTTWTVTNKNGADSTYNNTFGQITFNADGSVTFAGAIAAFGWNLEPHVVTDGGVFSECSGVTIIATYEALSSKAIYVLRQKTDSNPNVPIIKTANVVNLISAKKGELVLAGQGGCGKIGTDRISTLTLVPATGG